MRQAELLSGQAHEEIPSREELSGVAACLRPLVQVSEVGSGVRGND